MTSIRPFSYLFFAAGHEGMTELHAEVGFGFSGQEGKLAEVWVTGSIGYPLESMGHIYALLKKKTRGIKSIPHLADLQVDQDEIPQILHYILFNYELYLLSYTYVLKI